MQDYEKAILILQNLTKLTGVKASLEQNFVALYNLGIAYEETDQLELAINNYECALLID